MIPMIDFREELEKYKPALTMDDVENSVHSDEVQDIMDLLQVITKKVNKEK